MFFWKYACQMIFEGNNKQAPWGLLCASGLGIIPSGFALSLMEGIISSLWFN